MTIPLLNRKRTEFFAYLEVAIIILLAIVPLFSTFPFRVNIFLSWEGAYRLSQGQIPYQDFGMPLGYMYWVVPAIFFKLFGTQMITLVKAQVFINIVSGLAFRSIFKSIGIAPGVRLLSVIIFCISYSFFNFWPWYNHTVIVYEFIGLAFLMKYIFAERRHWLLLSLSALFLFFSFFTKQDGGGLAFMLAFVLLFYHCLYEKKWNGLLIFLLSYALVAFAIIAPLTKYNFGYWFNHGQPPHTSRFSAFDIVDEFFMRSHWLKFYLFMIVLLAIAYYKNWKQVISKKRATLFLLLTLGILAEAAILQVTSYTPPDNNIFFHSFACVFILSFLAEFLKIDFSSFKPLLVGLFGILLWWSGTFWKYFQRTVARTLPPTEKTATATSENIVDRKTYMIFTDTTEIPMSEWVFSDLKSFDKIYMPKPTVEGMQRVLNLDVVKNKKDLQVLNMTELTPLAVELPYKSETGSMVPLWHHLGVSMFNQQAGVYETHIARKEYDLVLFEHIPSLNNFFPFRVRDSLRAHYQKIDSFAAPRRGDTKGAIEVYIR